MVQSSRGKEQETWQGKTHAATQILPETLWAQEPMPSGIPPVDTIVVTITRQFGSGGADIARLVAQDLGLNYIDYEIIAEVAQRLGVDTQHAERQDEQAASMTRYILDAVRASAPLTANYRSFFDTAASLAQSKESEYIHLTQKVILEVATRGNAVIVGRGSQFLLHNVPRTLHIYIFAPLPYRIENIMRRYQLNHRLASQLIEQRDAERDNYLRHYYGNDGHQPVLYHLLINTGLFSIELAASLIKQALPVVKETR